MIVNEIICKFFGTVLNLTYTIFLLSIFTQFFENSLIWVDAFTLHSLRGPDRQIMPKILIFTF